MTVDKILERLAAIGPARRGQITEQWYDKTGKNGKKKRQGPYYVWTRYDDGKKITERVLAAEIDRARDELARGEEIGELFREFFRAKESEACGDSQKKRRRRDVAVRLRAPPGVRGNPAQDRRGGGADVRLAGGDDTRGRAQDGREVLGRFYTNELPALLGLSNAPGGCGRREVTVLSTVGEITCSRPYVTGPDGKRSFPLDTAMGVVAGCTPAMASLLSRAGAMNQSYESAGENASKMMGVHVEGRRIHRVVDAVSDEELEWIAERPVESCPKGGLLNIQADMTGLPLSLRLEGFQGQALRRGRTARIQRRGKSRVRLGRRGLDLGHGDGQVQGGGPDRRLLPRLRAPRRALRTDTPRERRGVFSVV